MNDIRLWVVGLGTVGQWLLHAVHANGARLEGRYGFVPRVVGVASARHGFVYDADGLDPPTVLEQVAGGRPLSELGHARHWDRAIEGLGATEADVLVEVTASQAPTGEPGLTHMREALQRGIPVVTSNKWPVALQGVQLAELARERGVAFRAESTVMSGTPVLSTLVEGLAGATPTSLRGVLNATANFIVTRMEEGASYEDALGAARELGLAERDPTADVEGFDAMAKAMILAGLVFGRQLRPEDVVRRGITEIDPAQIEAARSSGARVKQLVTLALPEPSGGEDVVARVEPALVQRDDPLAHISGVVNGIVCRADPVGEVMIAGPGAGPALAGQGVFSDLIAVARPARRGATDPRTISHGVSG
ncbi:MAG: homoserine dehydrogenase [Actinomycetota bacterium]|nr:homoserine dehydrogenase [Actinomycetota bacterium]